MVNKLHFENDSVKQQLLDDIEILKVNPDPKYLKPIFKNLNFSKALETEKKYLFDTFKNLSIIAQNADNQKKT